MKKAVTFVSGRIAQKDIACGMRLKFIVVLRA
jgi:hypothetical protein